MSDRKSATTRLIKTATKNRLFQDQSEEKKADFVRVLSKSKEKAQNYNLNPTCIVSTEINSNSAATRAATTSLSLL